MGVMHYAFVLLIADIKKPGGAAKEIESYFGCSASNLVLVGG